MPECTLTESEIRLIVREIVDERRKEWMEHGCRFEVKPDQVGQLMREVVLAGDGNFDKGVDVIADNHQWLKRRRTELEGEYAENHRWVKDMRGISNKIGDTVLRAVFMILAGGVLMGFLYWITGKTPNQFGK